jgi:DNA/RNA endonuclease YhcR with UshA esterase domain
MEEKDSKENNSDKIQSLRDMIYAAEKTLQGAKSMLLQLEGKKKVGRKRKISSEDEDGKIVEGTFDGQIMIGTDGKQYPVPANYASKSKLVEGDVLKLTITPDGSFIYKQIGPTERKRIIGTVNQDGEGNFFVLAENKPFRVLLASITYFKVTPGDEVTLIIPRDIESDWGAIENILLGARNKKIERDEPLEEISVEKNKSVIDEWMPNLEDLKKELKD